MIMCEKQVVSDNWKVPFTAVTACQLALTFTDISARWHISVGDKCHLTGVRGVLKTDRETGKRNDMPD